MNGKERFGVAPRRHATGASLRDCALVIVCTVAMANWLQAGSLSRSAGASVATPAGSVTITPSSARPVPTVNADPARTGRYLFAWADPAPAPAPQEDQNESAMVQPAGPPEQTWHDPSLDGYWFGYHGPRGGMGEGYRGGIGGAYREGLPSDGWSAPPPDPEPLVDQ